MSITVNSHVRITPRPIPEDLARSTAWEKVVDMIANPVDGPSASAVEFSLDSPLVHSAAELEAYARPSFPKCRPLMLALKDLMQRIHSEFEFKPGFTDTATPLSEVLKHRKGVCQDFAQLAIGCLRSLGLPARYVSGYIETLPPPGKEKLKGADVSHAWFSAYVPPRFNHWDTGPNSTNQRITKAVVELVRELNPSGNDYFLGTTNLATETLFGHTQWYRLPMAWSTKVV